MVVLGREFDDGTFEVTVPMFPDVMGRARSFDEAFLLMLVALKRDHFEEWCEAVSKNPEWQKHHAEKKRKEPN